MGGSGEENEGTAATVHGQTAAGHEDSRRGRVEGLALRRQRHPEGGLRAVSRVLLLSRLICLVCPIRCFLSCLFA